VCAKGIIDESDEIINFDCPTIIGKVKFKYDGFLF
jgi:hypothetical protein